MRRNFGGPWATVAITERQFPEGTRALLETLHVRVSKLSCGCYNGDPAKVLTGLHQMRRGAATLSAFSLSFLNFFRCDDASQTTPRVHGKRSGLSGITMNDKPNTRPSAFVVALFIPRHDAEKRSCIRNSANVVGRCDLSRNANRTQSTVRSRWQSRQVAKRKYSDLEEGVPRSHILQVRHRIENEDVDARECIVSEFYFYIFTFLFFYFYLLVQSVSHSRTQKWGKRKWVLTK